jgi:hypothetical protein
MSIDHRAAILFVQCEAAMGSLTGDIASHLAAVAAHLRVGTQCEVNGCQMFACPGELPITEARWPGAMKGQAKRLRKGG